MKENELGKVCLDKWEITPSKTQLEQQLRLRARHRQSLGDVSVETYVNEAPDKCLEGRM